MYKLADKKIMFYGDINFNLLPYLGWGSRSDVYKINIENNAYALKIFNGFCKEELDRYEEKLDIDIESYISPIKISYINGKFNGYVMKLCRGENLFDKKLNINISNFYKSAMKLYKDTYALSKLGYKIFDLYPANIMYDNGFKIIDMDDYKKNDTYSFDTLLKLNTIEINNILFEIFAKATDTESLFVKNQDLCKVRNDFILGKISFDEFFSIMLNIMNNREVYKLSKMGKVLKMKFGIQ